VAVVITATVCVGGLTVTRVVHSGKPPARTSSARPTASESRARSDFDRLKSRYGRHGYRVDLKVDANAAIDSDCGKHSYGTVQRYFRSTPCVFLARASFAVADKRKEVVLVAVSSVELPDVDTATRFRALVDRPGTGNITELSREVGAYRNVKYDGRIYTSSQNAVTVWNVQIMPAVGHPSPAVLKDITELAHAP
jgi:hypothetical protein